MKVNRRMFQSARLMRELEIPRQIIRERLSSAYNCLGRIFAQPYALEMGLDILKYKKLKGRNAVNEMIVKGIDSIYAQGTELP